MSRSSLLWLNRLCLVVCMYGCCRHDCQQGSRNQEGSSEMEVAVISYNLDGVALPVAARFEKHDLAVKTLKWQCLV